MIKILLIVILATSVISKPTLEESIEQFKLQLENLLGPGDFDFNPNSSTEIDSPLFWTINATCTTSAATIKTATFEARMRAGKGSINGKDVGGGLTLDIDISQPLKISAGSLAKVIITNKSSETVHASCSLGFERISEQIDEFIQNTTVEEVLEFLQ